ncbi:hypothetical protein [Streptomyces sp. NPDC007100]|uniref:hypothetical protein n=1 Tax=Streptomyces sp. NPDC007100 TaxID=3155602 RepID=UPI0033F50776
MCLQPLAWDARTRRPVPLHVAGAVDRNPPEYRGPASSQRSIKPARTFPEAQGTHPPSFRQVGEGDDSCALALCCEERKRLGRRHDTG